VTIAEPAETIGLTLIGLGTSSLAADTNVDSPMSETIAPPSARPSWLARGVAVTAVALGAASLAGGSPEIGLAVGVGGLAALGVWRQPPNDQSTPPLDLLRAIASRAATAQRLEGAVAVALECLVRGGHATAGVAMIRRNEGGLCDVYVWVDGQLSREDLLWQPDLAQAADGGAPPRLPVRLGRPRRWLARPIAARGEVLGALIAVEPNAWSLPWLGPALAVVAVHLGAQVLGERLGERVERGYVATIEALIGALEAKDPYTAGHSSRVAAYSVAIARELGLDDDLIDELQTGAILHDIGKIGVGDGVLLKAGRLSDAEFAEIKDHPRRGARIIDAFNRSPTVLGIVFHHHERYDGRGYPAGLRGVDIPLPARIVNVADAYDAMTTNRPYNSTKSRAEALAELQRGAGQQFDPDVVRALDAAFAKGSIS
jgi:putative nucleotidyltransferase with HDIG domain